MKYKIGDSLHGFVVEQSRHIKEIGGDLYILRHARSRAQLCYVDNDDRNMTYSVTFATPSKDSTGVFHILEHSVLCGSEKYPVDDPFVELMKSSLYTFLNAMTFPDKTMYPVSSMNEKDLMNLMAVYTDAVFRPLIYDNENAFRQEGWHIELDEDGKPYYQGVVYNEMKGALSDPDETLYTAVFREAYEPCQYTTVSGGHPDEIVKLSYEQFIKTHQKHYHPSNARFYLYGQMDLSEKLRFLDEEYLSQVEAQAPVDEPAVSVKKQEQPYFCTYSADSEKEGEDYIALSFPIGMMPSLERFLALSVLSAILAETNFDPLKKRILDQGLAVELECAVIEDICYPLFTIKLRNCDAKDLARVDEEITACLRELCENGLNKDAVRAKLSTAEFALREGNASGLTKGLYYNIQIADSWLYGYEPWRYLEYEQALENIKSGLSDGYFEKLIQETLLDNKYRSVVVMTPKAGETVYADPTDLPDGYSAENRRSDTDPTPHLDLSDIDRKTVPHITELKEQNGAPYLYHPLKTDGIVYADVFFDTADASDEELFLLGLISVLLTNVGTKAYSGEELQTALGLYTGSLSMSTAAYDSERCVLSACVLRYKAMADQLKDASALAQEILTNSRFDDRKIVCDLINQIYSDLKLGFINNSSQLAATRAAANHNVRDAISDKQRGLSFYLKLRDLKERLDGDPAYYDIFREQLEAVYRRYIVNGKAVLSLSCDEALFDTVAAVPLPMRDRLTDRLENADSPLLSGNVAVSVPCDIVFNGYSYNLSRELSSGELLLCKKILSLEYLWQKIRVESGAYGCGATPSAAHRLDLWSYRDPQVARTLKTYDEAAAFLSELDLSERALDDYIISCIRNLDNPQPPQAAAYISDLLYLSGRTDAILQKERDELLSADLGRVNAVGEKMKAAVSSKAYCTVGSASAIEQSRGLFDEVISL